MSESGLYPVQNWLWSELDDLGIDGMIYSRHLLDLLISSKHTFDYHLEEKEQSIFSKITPGAKKRKHKYSRRSSSFSACEEILWKKEVAVDCLLSAAETKANSEDTAATIHQVVDELYSKLAGLHLTADGNNAKSDGEVSLKDYNGNNMLAADCEKARKKENYEDAFPSLDGSSGSPASNKLSGSVWNKAEKRTESKSGRDSDNFLKCKPPHPSGKDPKLPRIRDNSSKKARFSPQAGSRSEGENTPGFVKKTRTYPLCPRNNNRRYCAPRKPRAASTGCAEVGYQRKGKPPRPKLTGRFQPKSRKSEQSEKNGDKSSPQKRKLDNPKPSFKENMKEVNVKPSMELMKNESMVNLEKPRIQLDYAHLPSWMETTLADFSNPYIWSSYEAYGIPEPNGDDSADEDPREMPFSNRWYRDEDTGLLTFKPLNSAKERSASSTSTISASSFLTGEEDELFEENSDPATPAAPESWMWCPSPSLWEDGQTSPVSRLQSVYKRELMSLGAEDHVDDISGRIWEEYKTIFLDLQEMDAGSDQENSTDESSDPSSPSHVWQMKDGNIPSPAEQSPEQGNEDVGNLCGIDEIDRKFELWSHPAPSAFGSGKLKQHEGMEVTSQGFNFQSKAHACVGDPAAQKSSSVDRDIWKYSQVWSTEDGAGVLETSGIQPDEELSVLMQDGAFGYLCHGRKTVWDTLPQKHPRHAIWGGGDMPSMEKPDTPQETYEERMMHTVVDALFSDMGFELLFDPNDDPLPYSARRQKMSRFTPVMSIDSDFSALSFGFRSLFVETPIENFRSPADNPWQPKWSMNDLFPEDGFAHVNPFSKLDDLFMSLASAEELDRQYSRLGETAKKKNTFLDSVTENEAWKTSLRIGNIWQAISGIRPVNVIYSENKPNPRPKELLIPSSATHFRPISASLTSEVGDSPGFDTTTIMDTPLMTNEHPELEGTGHDLNPINIPETNKTDTDATIQPGLKEEPSFQVNFSKLVHDKSMQTAFEMAVQQDMPSCQQFLTRPPKANSR